MGVSARAYVSHSWNTVILSITINAEKSISHVCCKTPNTVPYEIVYCVCILSPEDTWFAVTCLLVSEAVIGIIMVNFCQRLSYVFIVPLLRAHIYL